MIIGYDANSHPRIWGSTNTNPRGENLLQFIMANNLDIINVGNKPTFVTRNREEVLDVTIALTYLSNYVTNWHVSDEESCPDHRHINFTIQSTVAKETYRNPRRTDWETYRDSLETGLRGMRETIWTTADLEMAAEELNEPVISAFNDSCPLTTWTSTRNVPWWNLELA